MLVLIVIIAVLVVYIGITYNGFVRLKNRVKEAWSDIEVQMKRRYDLIPNLVESVRGAAKHERETLQSVVDARDAAMASSGNGAARGNAENHLTETLKSIFALAENYPTLRANENFLELQRELADTETKIQAARQFYNNVVMGLNTQIQQFPSNIVARMFNITEEEMFEMDDAEKKAPKVKF